MKERPDVRHLPTSELLRTAVEAFMPKRAPYSMTVLWQREVLAELDRRIPPPRFGMGCYLYGAKLAQDDEEA